MLVTLRIGIRLPSGTRDKDCSIRFGDPLHRFLKEESLNDLQVPDIQTLLETGDCEIWCRRRSYSLITLYYGNQLFNRKQGTNYLIEVISYC